MAMREYRKGNWTVEETMILIEAKKKDDERRKNRSKQTSVTTMASTSSSTGKPITELRWKCVEEYCWGKGCLRSQNQCNDKWDNLMRDYKKVRDYHKNLGDHHHLESSISSSVSNKSYWNMDKVERKDKGLPTNMLPQIYQALFDVVERSPVATTPTTAPSAAHFLLPPPTSLMMPAALQLSPPPPPPPLQPPPAPLAFQLPRHPSPTLETETSEPELSPAKRRRKEGGGGEREGVGGGEGEGASGIAAQTVDAAATTSLQEVSSAICRSATIISEAIQANEEREERRHREMMSLHESRLRIEESTVEINRQGLSSLTDAINRLATSIFTWANSQKNQQGPS